MVDIPDGVSVEVHGSTIRVKGPKGQIEKNFSPGAKIIVESKEVLVQNLNLAYTNTTN